MDFQLKSIALPSYPTCFNRCCSNVTEKGYPVACWIWDDVTNFWYGTFSHIRKFVPNITIKNQNVEGPNSKVVNRCYINGTHIFCVVDRFEFGFGTNTHVTTHTSVFSELNDHLHCRVKLFWMHANYYVAMIEESE